MIVKAKVGDKVTLSDWMYDDDRWGYAPWVTEARGLIGVVRYVGEDCFSIKWVGASEYSAANGAGWIDDWVKILGSTTE